MPLRRELLSTHLVESADATHRGVVDTALVKALGTAEQVNERLLARTALKRIAQPEEVAKVILFLLSDSAGYITSSVSTIRYRYRLG